MKCTLRLIDFGGILVKRVEEENCWVSSIAHLPSCGGPDRNFILHKRRNKHTWDYRETTPEGLESFKLMQVMKNVWAEALGKSLANGLAIFEWCKKVPKKGGVTVHFSNYRSVP